jgi:isocitrate lyase
MCKSASSGNGWDSPRWSGTTRAYKAIDIARMRGTTQVEYSLAHAGAEKLWRLLHQEEYIRGLGALTGNQAVEMAKAGLEAITLSGRQASADAKLAGQTNSDQSLYPALSNPNNLPNIVRFMNSTLIRASQIAQAEGDDSKGWMLPIVADAETGSGGVPRAFEVTKALIEAGAAAIHFDDQLPVAKKFGHTGGKVLVPAREAIHKLIAARLAADILDVPTVLIARTDASSAQLITSNWGAEDKPFVTGERTVDGFFTMRGGIDAAIARGLAYAPFADMLWCETSKPSLAEAKKFARAIHAQFPGKLLAYNCSPLSHLGARLNQWEISQFQSELAAMGYRFQFVTLAGFNALNHSTFELAHEYASSRMTAYSHLQQHAFELA